MKSMCLCNYRSPVMSGRVLWCRTKTFRGVLLQESALTRHHQTTPLLISFLEQHHTHLVFYSFISIEHDVAKWDMYQPKSSLKLQRHFKAIECK